MFANMLGYFLTSVNMKILNICNKIIEYSFYLLFFLVPLALTGDTSELFEFNKLWATFILTIVIGAAWTVKMLIKKEFKIQRTPLDIPILLFLGSEIISTLLSIDMHTSLWGYYSRFNGGLFSIFAFVFLYYAFVSNLLTKEPDNSAKQKIQPAYDYIKGALAIAGGVGAFVLGTLISTAIKPTVEAGIPFQLIAMIVTVVISFALFMKAAPLGTIKKSLFAIFSSGAIVLLWGLPSHFGYDPTCLLFRGTFDVSCWTTDFYPKVRMFSTLGQPDWLAAYLGILIPVLTAILLNFTKDKQIFNKKNILNQNFLLTTGFIIFYIAMYAGFVYAMSRTAIIALWISLFAFFIFYFWFYLLPKLSKKIKSAELKVVSVIIALTIITTFFTGLPGGFPFNQIQRFTWPQLSQSIFKPEVVPTAKTNVAPTPAPVTPFSTGELGGTDSTKIRSFVWKGAIEIWKHNPVFGTGVETYAFAYYQYRPVGHNMTSEWQYLYNKAHNEFLNYLATTGTVGIITYLLMIGGFYYFGIRFIYQRRKNLGANELLVASFLAAHVVIDITNFGGFSVVIVNIFFYIFPAILFALTGLINFDKTITFSLNKDNVTYFGNGQKILSLVALAIAGYLIYTLVTYWNADRNYYYGQNYDHVQDYQKAYTFLKTAVSQRPGEPVFQDELAYNNAILGASILSQAQSQKDQAQIQQAQSIASQLINSAITTENQVTSDHPNNVVFWKTKVRIFYTLAQLNPSYYPLALEAIKKTSTLAPTDADVFYNLGVLYGQNGDFRNATTTLQKTIQLKPDYKNGAAYYALAIFYHQLAVDPKGVVVNQTNNQKAIDTLKLLLKYFGPNQQASDALKTWNGGQQ
jgi:putative inorganic carbon (hco3(-)) transporter